MAVLFITEYARQGRDAAGYRMVVAEEPPVTSQVVTIGGASAQSSAFNAKTHLLRISTDAICSIEFGTDPTALTTSRRMPANSTEYFAVPPGASYKVAVISNT